MSPIFVLFQPYPGPLEGPLFCLRQCPTEIPPPTRSDLAPPVLLRPPPVVSVPARGHIFFPPQMHATPTAHSPTNPKFFLPPTIAVPPPDPPPPRPTPPPQRPHSRSFFCFFSREELSLLPPGDLCFIIFLPPRGQDRSCRLAPFSVTVPAWSRRLAPVVRFFYLFSRVPQPSPGLFENSFYFMFDSLIPHKGFFHHIVMARSPPFGPPLESGRFCGSKYLNGSCPF